jgi:hypothetical protein
MARSAVRRARSGCPGGRFEATVRARPDLGSMKDTATDESCVDPDAPD